MINNKVAPDDYERLRKCFFRFCSAYELTIEEAMSVLSHMGKDLVTIQLCSGQVKDQCGSFDSNGENKEKPACQWDKPGKINPI